ncbi:MAG: energy transducer TonB [Bacteroidota bacterium]
MQIIQAKTFEKMSLQSLQQLVVRFTITEIGNPVDVKIIKSSMDLRTDQLMIDIIKNMKGWKPAENSKGIKQRQEFTIPLGGSGGC